MNEQLGLFSANSELKSQAPLAHRSRPKAFKEHIGISVLLQKYPFLKATPLPSVIFHGPAGCGKTTLALLLGDRKDYYFSQFNAVMDGIPALKKVLDKSLELQSFEYRPFILFIDEIHRFNKTQQDALLPHVESGRLILIGATTEVPRTVMGRALLSRVRTVELHAPEVSSIIQIVSRACAFDSIQANAEAIEMASKWSAQDPRKAIGIIELAWEKAKLENRPSIEASDIKAVIARPIKHYDKDGDRHYDIISAFIKSVRGSDVDSALLWLAAMLEGGEDPLFIARRLIILSSEDIGNADPQALTLATSTYQALQFIGMPEGRIPLSQLTIYLSKAEKSNSAYLAINKALAYVKDSENIIVPGHLHSRPRRSDSVPYISPHGKTGLTQKYAPDNSPSFYFQLKQDFPGPN